MQSFDNTSCVILAAGLGKRMHAPHSKVLCEVLGKPMLRWVIDAAKNAGVSACAVVASSDDVKSTAADCEIYEQSERLGTGHAVMCAKEFLKKNSGGDTLVLCGDAPLIDPLTISDALEQHRSTGAAVTVITALMDEPSGYGRIVRSEFGVTAIVEDADCTDAQKKICEINSGSYWFKTDELLAALDKLTNDNAQKEYYLTDTVGILLAEGKKAGGFKARMQFAALGANSPLDLLALNEIASHLIIGKHLANGVHFTDTNGVSIGPDVEIAAGATILPGTMLYGKTKIGARAVIGPNSMLWDTEIGEETHFNSSQSHDSTVGNNTTIGPFVQLRPDSHIGNKVKIGDFVEIKNATIGDGTSVAHLTYVGDSTVGKCCNFGCGVVIVNYDGEIKNRCEIGDFCFIGCNTNLVAPVKIGDGAYTAAATTVTEDVPAGALAIGRSRQTNIEGWAAKKLKKYIEKKSK